MKKPMHGIRKLTATMAAEQGATDKQLDAFFGWLTGEQSQTYTAKADRLKLAVDAAKTLPQIGHGFPHPATGAGKIRKK